MRVPIKYDLFGNAIQLGDKVYAFRRASGIFNIPAHIHMFEVVRHENGEFRFDDTEKDYTAMSSTYHCVKATGNSGKIAWPISVRDMAVGTVIHETEHFVTVTDIVTTKFNETDNSGISTKMSKSTKKVSKKKVTFL